MDLSDKNNLRKFINETHGLKKPALGEGVLSSNVFTWEHFDDILFSWDFSEELKIYLDGRVDEKNFVETYFQFGKYKKRIIPSKFYSYIQRGASLVLNKANEKSVIINDICNFISRSTGSISNANGYAACGGTGTFDVHWDTHDVYATQLIGKKRWRVYSPSLEDPLPSQKSKYCSDKPSVPVMDIILEAGDVLYIPRGWWHEAIPLDNQETFHIAVGVYPVLILDYLNWVIHNKSVRHVSVRSYLDDATHGTLEKVLENIAGDVLSEENYVDFLTEFESSARHKTNFNTGLFFSKEKFDKKTVEYNRIFNKSRTVFINGMHVEDLDNGLLFAERISQINLSEISEDEKRKVKKLISLGVVS